MKIKILREKWKWRWSWSVRSTLVLCLTGFFLISIYAEVVSKEIAPENEKISLTEALYRISVEYQVFFSYDQEAVQDVVVFYEPDRYENVEHALDRMLIGTSLHYRMFNNRYIILYESHPEAINSLKDMVQHLESVIDKEEKGPMRKLAPPLVALPARTNSFSVQKIAFSVSGTVTDQDGEPLIGVNIQVKGTDKGTSTDIDGKFKLEDIDENAILIISYVGYQTQEIPVAGKSSLEIVMVSDAELLDEVVVVGYGTLRQNRISTSITSLDPERVKVQVASSVDKSLEGQIAGLNIRQSSGAPGGGAEMQIRGAGSIGAGDQPLIVIDGVPMQNMFGKERSPLSMLNQEDIASIDVLKGVSAAAIYGSRGSNGVILITTESGKVGKTEFSFSSRFGMEKMLEIERLDLMNAEEFATWRKENLYEEAKFYGNEIDENDIPEVYRNPELLGEGTDWQKIMTRVAPTQEYNLSVSHGSDAFRGFFSLGYLDNKGIIKETSFERISMLANMSYSPNKYISVGLNLNPTIRTWKNEAGGRRTSLFGSAAMSSPLDGPYKEDGLWERDNKNYYDGDWDLDIWSPGTFSNNNPLYSLLHQVDDTRNLNLRFQPHVVLHPIDGLTLNSQYNIQLAYDSHEYFKPSTISDIYNPPPLAAYGTYSNNRSNGWQFVNTATYEKAINKHSINALVGYTREHYNHSSNYIRGNQYPSDDIKTINASTEQIGNTSETNWALSSYLLRINYDYNIKYLFTGTLRRDGSSRFGSANRWGYFPSVSVGWNLTEEGFFPNLDWLSNLKLRGSIGVSGNNSIGNYTWIPTLTADNYNFGGKVGVGKRVSSIENTRLGWEKSKELDVGIDLTLFSGRFDFIFDYYDKVTEDMLWAVAVPISSGFSSVQDNIGKIRNRGVEFAISSFNITNKNFTWKTDFNISFNRNKVLDMGEVGRIIANGYSLTIAGKPMAMFYGWKHMGILNSYEEVEKYATFPNQLPGTIRFADIDGNGIIDERDKTIIGNPHPKFRGGLNNSFSYKNWDINLSLSFAHDFDIYAQLEEDVLNLDGVFNSLREVKDRWRSAEQPGAGRIPSTFHQTTYYRHGNSEWVHNASFLKIQNINIGYTFSNIKYLRLYGTIQNAFVFTNYRYGNPDANVYAGNSLARNFDNYDYPLTRSITLGIDLKF